MRAVLLLFFVICIAGAACAQFRLYEKGYDNYKEGKYDDAILLFSEYMTKATRDKSLDVEVFYLRALSYYKKNNYAKAIDDFDEAILLDHPNKGNIYWFKAKCRVNLNAHDEGIGDYTRALKELESDKQVKAKLLYERSQVHSRKGDVNAVYADLKEAKEAYDGNADVNKEFEKIEKQNVAIRGTQTNTSVKEAQKKSKEELITKKEVTQTSPQKKDTVAPPVQGPSKNEQPAKLSGKNENVVKNTPPAPTLADQYKDERRFALVIGNSNYPKQIGVLRNPVNDATDMAKELEKSNFNVQLLTNATYGQMRAALLKFKEMVDAGEKDKTVSLFYYAGHGVQQESENFLVPVDAAIEFEDDIPRYCFPVQRMVLANMERSNARMNIVILDACRNNPFPALTRSLGEQGLGEMKRARGSFIAYATAPGSVASDGAGRNGLYTQELIKAIQKPGRTIEQVFKEVRQNVLQMSGNRQNTWDSSNIIGEFYFKF